MEKIKTFCAFLSDYPTEEIFKNEIAKLEAEVNEFLKDPNIERTGAIQTIQKNVIVLSLFYKTLNK